MFIRFGAEYDAGRHLISGWSNPEERIVWSNDRKSVLRFDSPKFRGDWSLALTVLTFSPPCQPYQAVTISINGFVIAEQIFRGPEASIELLVRFSSNTTPRCALPTFRTVQMTAYFP